MQQGSTSVQRLRVIWVTRALIALLAFGFAVPICAMDFTKMGCYQG